MTRKPNVEVVPSAEIKPGDVIEMFDRWWNVRYLNFYAGSTRYQLQREEDKLHPLCDKTCMQVEIYKSLDVKIKRQIKRPAQ